MPNIYKWTNATSVDPARDAYNKFLQHITVKIRIGFPVKSLATGCQCTSYLPLLFTSTYRTFAGIIS